MANRSTHLAVIIVLLLVVPSIWCWREASRCTVGSSENGNQPSTNEEIIQNAAQLLDNAGSSQADSRVLTLNCDKNLIFIAWSHYGHQSGAGADDYLLKSAMGSGGVGGRSNGSSSSGCYFSPKDCMVNVDYVANECNGLSTCQISLDAQYLHSCKSYSDYLFIVYDCIEAKSTVDVCDSAVDVQASGDESTIYLQSPNYPNEYLSNLDCNCSLRSTRDSSVHIELLEFDLESADDYSILSGVVNTNGAGSLGPNAAAVAASGSSMESAAIYKSALDGKSPLSAGKSRFDSSYSLTASSVSSSASSSAATCSKDYFAVGSAQSCGSLSPFNNLVGRHRTSSSSALHSYTTASHQVTNLRFFSDDALTRRGFWLKIKASSLKQKECPENFVLVDDLCLRVYNEPLTWYEAQNFCNNLGYSLALIDNFELDRQLNKLVFDKEDTAPAHKARFWMGIRHLNETNWFDHKNEVIRFRSDEANWWPWLVVDSNTYNKGSCLGKRRNMFFLEDCYKRMPFACQYKPKAKASAAETDKIQLRCGKNAAASFYEQPTTTTTTTTTNARPSSTASKLPLSTNQILNIELNRAELGGANDFDVSTRGSLSKLEQQMKKLVSSTGVSDRRHDDDEQTVGEVNMPFTVKKTGGSDSKISSSDSTVLIGLICSIAVLIAVINSIVVVVICRRRKFMLKQQACEKDSKSSQDTMSSASGAGLHHMDDACHGGVGVNSTSTLTFSGNGSSGGHSISSNTHLPLFMHHDEHAAITINPRRAGFASNFDRTLNMNSAALSNNNKSIGRFISTLAPSSFNNGRANLANVNRLNQVNNQLNNADPLGHIYETISVSSASNANIVSMGLDGRAAANSSGFSGASSNNYNVFNHYHLHQASSCGPSDNYNDIECDVEARNPLSHFQQQQQLMSQQQQQQILIMGNYNDLSPNESSSSASSASQRSGDFFLINKEQNASSSTSKSKSKSSKSSKPKGHVSKDINQNWTINNNKFFDRHSSSNRFSDINVSTNTSSPSCSSSTATTMTELNGGGGMNTSGGHQFSLQPGQTPHPIVLFTHHLPQPSELANLNLIQNNSHFTTLNPSRQSQRDLLNTLTHNFNQFNQQQQQQAQQQSQQAENLQHINFFANRIEAVV